MTKMKFYKDLTDEPPETIELGGMVLIYKNNRKWHLCKKRAASVGYACGSGRPNYHNKVYFNKSSEVVEPREALEKGRICSNCERILQNEFGLERMVVALTSDKESDIQRFVNRREKTLK